MSRAIKKTSLELTLVEIFGKANCVMHRHKSSLQHEPLKQPFTEQSNMARHNAGNRF